MECNRWVPLLPLVTSLSLTSGCINRSYQEARYEEVPHLNLETERLQMQMDSPTTQALTGSLPADRKVAPIRESMPMLRNLALAPTTVNRAPASQAPVQELHAMKTLHAKSVQKGEACSSIEYPGMGPAMGTFLARETEQSKKMFESAKKALLRWAQAAARRNQEGLSPETLAFMKKQLESVTLSTKAVEEEPDLAWRGIGILSQDLRGNPMIQLGGGFTRLVKENPERARFELTRLLAQAWSPCQFKTAGLTQPWGEYLGCMKVDAGEKACEAQNVSEAGWAVSSVVALKVAQPGCVVPAFQEADSARCAAALLVPQKADPKPKKNETRTAQLSQ